MENCKELNQMLDAINNILAGKQVEDLNLRIKQFEQTQIQRLEEMTENIDLYLKEKSFIYNITAVASYENRILQGEHPDDVYRSGIYGYGNSDYKEVQKTNLEFLRGISERYHGGK